MIVSRCSSLSVAHFCSSKKAKLTVTHNIYWSALKSLSCSAAAPFPKIISNFRSRNNQAKEAKTCFFWDSVIIIRVVSSLPKLALLFWAILSVFYWNRAEIVSYSVTGEIYRSSFVHADPCGQWRPPCDAIRCPIGATRRLLDFRDDSLSSEAASQKLGHLNWPFVAALVRWKAHTDACAVPVVGGKPVPGAGHITHTPLQRRDDGSLT